MAKPQKIQTNFELSIKQKDELVKFWKSYEKSGFKVQDLKGNEFTSDEFSKLRNNAITEIQKMIKRYLSGQDELKIFKSTLDSYNKRYNYWGFAAMKGQMFFNQLWNACDGEHKMLDEKLKEVIDQPKNLNNALEKIDSLEQLVIKLSNKVDDRRKAPKVGSVAYFLSYFWQIEDSDQFPIFYTSLQDSLYDLDLWPEFENQSKAYAYFFNIMNEIKHFLESQTKSNLHHWDVEHCFWKDRTDSGTKSPAQPLKENETQLVRKEFLILKPFVEKSTNAIYEYIPPIVSDLIEAGAMKGDTRAIKGVTYEKKIATMFRMLDFEVDKLGQGKGREPDGIITYRQENIAFIYDAKVRENGYSIGVDDRAIKEYIEEYHTQLDKKGYKKIGFLIISSEFNGNPKETIDELTIETPIKRIALVKSEALLHLLSHKLSSGISTSEIAKFLLQNGILAGVDVDEAFADV